MSAATATKKEIKIQAPRMRRITLVLVGSAPLLCNRFTEEQMRAITDKRAGKGQANVSEKTNPEKDWEKSLYPMPDGKGWGFPASGIKKAMVEAASFIGSKALNKKVIRGALFPVGDFLLIQGVPNKRSDSIRNPSTKKGGVAQRAEFKKWRIEVTIEYDETSLTEEAVVTLCMRAGIHIGIGDWRPEKGGSMGRFDVEAKS